MNYPVIARPNVLKIGEKRQKVLIVTSAILNPSNVLYSCVEMTQARLLSEVHDVALLSVWPSLPGGMAEGRRLVANLVRAPSAPHLRDLAHWCHTARLGPVRRHLIGGLEVYEGTAVLRGESFEGDLSAWVKGAFAAFESYCRDHGKPDLIHAHGRFLNAGAFALEALRSRQVPYVYTEHCSFYQRGIAPAASRKVLSEVILRSRAYAPVSRTLANAVTGFLGDIRTPAITPNALDPAFEDEPPTAPPSRRSFRFFNASSLDELKGIDVLLEAFSRAFGGEEAFTLTICGDGAQRKQLEGMASELGIGRQVKFEGWRPNEDIVQLMDQSHAVVISSRVETFGVVAIESLARGRPVLATRCGGPEEIVTEADGLMVPPDDPAALAKGLASIVSDYGRFDQAAMRARALARYGRHAFLGRIAEIYANSDADDALDPGEARTS